MRAAPRSDIGYLRAQEGLFTYFDYVEPKYIEDGQWPSVESEGGDVGLAQLLLHLSEVPELERLLLAEGVTLAHLMPTHDNVTKTLAKIWRYVD